MLALLHLVIPLFLLPFSVNAGTFGGGVINLDAKQFKKVMATEHASMVAFYAPWCGHCKTLAPKFEASASSLSPLIPFYAIDCDASPNKPLCAEYGIKGFPTIKAFPRGSKGAARDYNGARETGEMVEFAKGLVPDRVKKMRVEKGVEGVLQGFLDEKPTLPHVLLVHPSAPSIPFLWKVLAHRLTSKMHLGYIKDSTSHSVLSSLGLYDAADTSRDATRAVLWQPGADRSELVEYDGILKFNALLDWLQSQTPSTKSKSTTTTTTAAAPKKTKTSKEEKEAQKVLEKAIIEEKVVDILNGEEGVPLEGSRVEPPAPEVEEEVGARVVEEEEVVEEAAADPEPEGRVHEEL